MSFFDEGLVEDVVSFDYAPIPEYSVKQKLQYEKEVLVLAKKYFDSLADATINSKKFSNGRFVRNLYERTFAKACTRAQISGSDTIDIATEDFASACSDTEFLVEEKKPARARIGF